ncbi:hypothetical protein L1887_24191 [Cichorium endivia]|nr:hypothetical protein L1887_24191 [Cichorium endivia]
MIGEATLKSMEVMLGLLEDEDESEAESSQRVSRKIILRDRWAAHNLLMAHYFNDDAIYESKFRRRFRMQKHLFMRIITDLTNFSEYISQRPDARGVEGFTPIQKCACAVRQLACGSVGDSWDEYFQMSERTTRETLEEFCRCVIEVYGPRYLRKPTFSDVQALYAHQANVHGFPGMLGSLDCLHWSWTTCPSAWHGQFTRGDKTHPTVILEAVASQDLWIWHAFFGAPGSINDINVLNMSPLFDGFCNGSAPDCPFQVNGTTYKYGYYLVDGIYPEYAVLVKSLTCPGDAKRIKFKAAQERARKDVERAFGVLKKRWQILENPARPRSVEKLSRIMYACIILHNMIIEDQGKAICQYVENEEVPSIPPIEPGSPPYVARRREIRNNQKHHELRADLAEHIYRLQNLDLNMPPQDDSEEYSD